MRFWIQDYFVILHLHILYKLVGVHLSADYYRVYKMCTRNIEGWKNVNKITLNFGLDYLQSSRHKVVQTLVNFTLMIAN